MLNYLYASYQKKLPMKNAKSILFIIPILFLLISCGSAKISAKKMVTGYWKNDQLIQKDQRSEEENFSTDENGLKLTLEFRADKSATLTYPKKTLNGTWKIDDAGKTITFIDKDSGKNIEIHLDRITPDALGVLETSPQGDRIIKYLREK